MSVFIAFALFCQALGALTGAVAAVWGELAYVRARKDGHIDVSERAHLRVLAHGLRFGMTLLLLASFALVITAYLYQSPVQPATTSDYWALILTSLLVVYVSWALSRKKISFPLGSAIVFAGWWFLAYLTMGLTPALSLGALIGFFVVATAIWYAILEYGRMLMHRR